MALNRQAAPQIQLSTHPASPVVSLASLGSRHRTGPSEPMQCPAGCSEHLTGSGPPGSDGQAMHFLSEAIAEQDAAAKVQPWPPLLAALPVDQGTARTLGSNLAGLHMHSAADGSRRQRLGVQQYAGGSNPLLPLAPGICFLFPFAMKMLNEPSIEKPAEPRQHPATFGLQRYVSYRCRVQSGGAPSAWS